MFENGDATSVKKQEKSRPGLKTKCLQAEPRTYLLIFVCAYAYIYMFTPVHVDS